jgi:hypothetical protein
LIFCTASSTSAKLYDGSYTIFGIHLSATKPVYRIGEQVQIELAITNKANEEYSIDFAPPWTLVRVTAYDSAGRRVPGPGTGSGRVLGGLWRFGPNETHLIKWPNPSTAGSEWADLANWGYSFKETGTYTLVASPTMVAYRKGPSGLDAYPVSAQIRSNSVTIKIVN